ncbi:hypothetical protein YTPLAS18_06770 [Nitrospira sp.]|nr:hypothetical protein YTPLAS18_06770 [Nitrospira sp.]
MGIRVRYWSLLAFALVLLLTGCGGSDAIVVIAAHPTNPNILYVVTNDYVYKTRDGGRTYENVSRGVTHSRVISMAIDPVYPATVYAGTKGDALFKSHNGGQTWVSKRKGLDEITISSVVNQLLFDPNDTNHLIAATTMGVKDSKDGGDTWVKRMEGMNEVLMVVSVAIDPKRPNIFYAGTSGGVYRSFSGGEMWEKANTGLVPPEVLKSSRALNVSMLLVDVFEPDTVYAATLNGMYKSTDKASSWTRIGASLTDPIIPVMILDRTKRGTLYIGGRFGILRSTDGGATWQPINQGLTSLNVRSLVQSPIDPKVFYLGTNGSGLYKSENAGETWVAMPEVKETVSRKPSQTPTRATSKSSRGLTVERGVADVWPDPCWRAG